MPSYGHGRIRESLLSSTLMVHAAHTLRVCEIVFWLCCWTSVMPVGTARSSKFDSNPHPNPQTLTLIHILNLQPDPQPDPDPDPDPDPAPNPAPNPALNPAPNPNSNRNPNPDPDHKLLAVTVGHRYWRSVRQAPLDASLR